MNPGLPVFIALGSNLDEPEVQLARAVQELRHAPVLRDMQVSTFRWTDPIGPIENQPRFLNGVVAAKSGASAHELLYCLQRIENEMGLVRATKVQQGPRRIDLDLLFVGNVTCDDPELMLPHPRLTQRRFVLEPLAELAPNFVHPVTRMTILEHLKQLKGESCAA